MFTILNKLGVSLIEYAIVIAIIAILSVLTIPTFISLANNHRISGTSEGLYYALQYARAEAIKRNANVYVSFVTGSNWCYGVNVGANCTCSTAGSCGLLTVSAPSATQLSLSSTYGTNYVYFEGTHGAANTNGSLTFTLYNSTPLVTISVGVMGNLTMCSTGVPGYTAC